MVGNGASVLPTVRDKSQIEIAITWASSSYDLSGTRARWLCITPAKMRTRLFVGLRRGRGIQTRSPSGCIRRFM